MTGLFYAHSGLRYLVLLFGVAAVLYFAYAAATRKPVGKATRALGAAFAGALDLQILLGLLLFVLGSYYPAIVGHLVMMLLAALVAHGSAVLGRSQTDPQRAHAVRLVGVLIALGLIAGGVAAIGRSVFGSGAPTITG